ncbi:MAG: hypothetical protein ACYTBS_04295 [Planctomycetota bacterium]|jgi:hypothetical protein
MTMQYEQNNINLQGVQAISSLIYDPNSSEQTDIIFNDWNALLGKAQEIPGIKEIIIAGGAGAIPAGVYDMTDIRLIGETAFSILTVDNVVLDNLNYIEQVAFSAGVAADNVVSTFQYSAGAVATATYRGCVFQVGPLATVPMFAISGGSTVTWVNTDCAFLSTNPGVPLIAVDATSTLSSQSLGGEEGNNWGGPLGSSPFVDVTAGGVFTIRLGTGDIFWAQNQVNGPTTVNRIDDYESAVVADWSGVEPLNVKTALDRIAAAIGPIA